MSYKIPSATLTAAHATKPTPKKEEMLKESDTSASMEISKLLKIFHSTNWLKQLRPQKEEPQKNHIAFLTTSVTKTSQKSVSQLSTHAQTKTVVD